MSAFEEGLMILGMMVVTFGVRYPTLALSGRYQFPLALKQALRFVPVAVLTAFVVPLIIAPEGDIALKASNEYLVAGLASIAIAWFSRHLLLTIVLGMALFLLLRFLT